MIDDKKFDLLMKQHSPYTKTEYYPIESKVLNGLLGGKGLPKGSVLHIAAGSGAGKSTICLRDICLDLLKQGQDIAYIDADRGINDEILDSTGVLPFKGNRDKKIGGCFMVFTKSTFKEINDLVQDLVDAGFSTIVVDTISIIDSGMYMGKDAYDIENMRVGGESQKLRQLLKNFNSLAEQDSRRVNFILLNHTAKDIGGFTFGAPKETPKGGDAPIQFSSIVIQLYKHSDKSETLNDKPIGQKVYAQIIKSRYANGKVKTPFFIRYGRGISNILTYKDIFESGKIPGVGIEAIGRTYYLKHPKLTEEIKYVGKDNLTETIIQNYSTIDKLFTSKDWMVDISEEAKLLDVEFTSSLKVELPKILEKLEQVSVMNGKVYFFKQFDSDGGNYAVYYDLTLKKAVKEVPGSEESLLDMEVAKAVKRVAEILENYEKKKASKTVKEKLDEVNI